PEALAALARHGCNDPTVAVEYSYSPVNNFPVLPARLEEGIYRIAQEALANACNHARAQHIDVTLTLDDHDLHFVVQDDGQGFDPDNLTRVGAGTLSGGLADQPGGLADQPGGLADQPGGLADQPGGLADQPGGLVMGTL